MAVGLARTVRRGAASVLGTGSATTAVGSRSVMIVVVGRRRLTGEDSSRGCERAFGVAIPTVALLVSQCILTGEI